MNNELRHFLSTNSGIQPGISYLTQNFNENQPVKTLSTLPSLFNKLERYFGYYWVQNDYDDLNSVKDYCNCSVFDNEWLATEGGVFSNLTTLIELDIQSLLHYRSAGLKAIITFSGIFYSNLNTQATFDTETYTARWNTYWDAITPYLDTVLAFYLDEPTMSMFENVDFDIVRAKITSVPEYSIHQFVVLTPAQVIEVQSGTYIIPSTFEWIGFDEYFVLTSEECYGGVSIGEKTMILANAYPDAKILSIGNGFFASFMPVGTTQQTLIYLNQNIIGFGNTLPNWIGMIVFAYDLSDNPGFTATVKQLPELELYLSITGNVVTKS